MRYIPLFFVLYKCKKLRFGGNEITSPKVRSHIHLEPKPIRSPWGNTMFPVCGPSHPTESSQWWENKQCYMNLALVFLFLPHAHFSLYTFPPVWPHFNSSLYFFPKANMPCETWSTGSQVGTTATTQRARPCRMTRWPPSAAPCTKWSPRTWRTPRPYGMRAASRSWLASPKAKEISKSDGDFTIEFVLAEWLLSVPHGPWIWVTLLNITEKHLSLIIKRRKIVQSSSPKWKLVLLVISIWFRTHDLVDYCDIGKVDLTTQHAYTSVFLQHRRNNQPDMDVWRHSVVVFLCGCRSKYWWCSYILLLFDSSALHSVSSCRMRRGRRQSVMESERIQCPSSTPPC